MDAIKDIVISVLTLLIMAVFLFVLRTKRQDLVSTLLGLIQQAETAISGSGLGAEKKAWVIAQLRISGMNITDGIDKLIDFIVKQLNTEGGWLVDAIKNAAMKENK